GLVVAGPCLVAWAAGLFGRFASGSSALLAARRIADNPKGAFRAVSGLTLAGFLGTMGGVIIPALDQGEQTPPAGALSNVPVGQVGLSATAGQQLVKGLSAISGASVYPLYELPSPAPTQPPGSSPAGKGQGGPGAQPGDTPGGGVPAGNGNVENPK